ncbi:uncharacterized protein E0L32_008634 [Thyridium curvatum]|uniref:Saccharopine dehydrogenase NADP binding domain-containing protein n=1 Tax=Thyridium curvatum TaxID=1093900 RepID=A0A507AJD9_9PEZI|nr:uncharacterized protein E0L32_008634 [Thyridium curvatum]TPX10415.1 hypothetical protein E0L32_008634 [Thyridium curvatum]
MPKLMIYGATGYTGRMAAMNAKKLGLAFTIGGRTESILKILASSLNVTCCTLSLGDTSAIDTALDEITVLLNCAGPFMRTAEPLMRACLRTGTHYLDIAAELDSYELAETLDDEAKRANVMLLPGCGGSVAMLGCLSEHVLSAQTRPPARIDIALHVAGSMSRGSARSALENLTASTLVRQEGRLTQLPNGAGVVKFDFDDGNGAVDCFPITLPDLITIWRSTGVGNIRTYVCASGDAFPSQDLGSLPDGPTEEQMEAWPYHAAVVVTDARGKHSAAVLHTVNGYAFTAMASAEAARRVLEGEASSGFQTPVQVFGKDFVNIIPGSVVREG